MHLFLTSVLPFLAHLQSSAVAFLTCRHHNFHASIIPEFLSDEERVKSFCETRQQKKLEVNILQQYKKLYNLVVQTPLMQFSPSLLLCQEDCVEVILEPLLQTKYFTRTLQRCILFHPHTVTNDLLQALSKVQSLTKLDLGWSDVKNEHLEVIINSFRSLETFTIQSGFRLDPTTAIRISSPPPPATKTLRSLKVKWIDSLLATQFIPCFSNLRKLALKAQNESRDLDLLPLTSSLTFLTDLDLENFTLKNTESLKNLVHLSTLRFRECPMSDSLSFLTQDNTLPHLTTLSVQFCDMGFPTSSFTSLRYVSNLRVLQLNHAFEFNNYCLRYLKDMVHLRKLDLSGTDVVGDCRSLKNLMQNLFQLEELNLSGCSMGNRGAIAGALYSTHSRVRFLNLRDCNLVDDDLNGIGKLKNTLEVLHLASNDKLTNEGLMHCKDLVKLKVLNLQRCYGINDLSPLKNCLNLEELDVSCNDALTDDSFKVFSEEPNSFPHLRVLNLSLCRMLSEEVVEHLSKNNYLVLQLKEISVGGIGEIVTSSPTALNNIYQLKGLRALKGILDWESSEDDENQLKGELMRGLKNLEEVI